MRKALVAALVVTFVLSIAATASAAVLPAAPFTDVAGHAAADTITKLYNLGVFKGDPSGTVRPNDPVTRAEFCAVVVRAMGLETAAKYSATPTKFADVGPEKAWAWGYINVAVAKGVIKGYADGNFGPDDPVTYAQAVTMLARAIGYVDLPGEWPANYIMVAVTEGLTDNATFDAPAPATRGDLAFMTWNAMNAEMVKMVKAGDVVTYEEFDPDKFLLPGTKIETAKVVDATPDVDATLKSDEIKLDGVLYKVPAGIDSKVLLGHEVTGLYKTDASSNKVITFLSDVTAASAIVTGTVTVDATDAKVTVKATGATTATEYDWASGVKVFRNKVAATKTDVKKDDAITLFLNSDGDVRFASAFALTDPGVIVTSVDVKGVAGATANKINGTEVADNATILKNGVPAKLSDIAKDDVADMVKVSGKWVYVAATNAKVTGTVANVLAKSSGTFVVLGSTEYKLGTGCQDSLDGGTVNNSTAATLSPYIGYTATISLNPSGEARFVAARSSAIVGVLKSIDTTAKTIKIDVKGTEVSFSYVAGTATADLDPANVDDPFVLKANAEGKITSAEKVDLAGATTYTVVAVDTSGSKLTLSNGGVVSVVAVSADAGLKVNSKWAGLTALGKDATIKYYAPAGSIMYAEATYAVTTAAYGKYVGYVTDALNLKTTITVDIKGSATEYVKTGTTTPPSPPSVAEDAFVKVALTPEGTWDTVTALTEFAPASAEVVAVGGDGWITYKWDDAGTWKYVAVQIKDLPVYDKDGNASSTAAVVVGKTIKFWREGTTDRIVQITN